MSNNINNHKYHEYIFPITENQTPAIKTIAGQKIANTVTQS